MSFMAHKLSEDALTIMDNLYKHEGAPVIETSLLRLSSAPEVAGLVPKAPLLADRLRDCARHAGLDERELALSSLYLTLHSAGAQYMPEEDEILARAHGIPKQPGGMTPILLSAPFVKPESTVVELGAGNGLQGLLLQSLARHAQTVMVEISGSLIETGRVLQRAMGLKDESVRWHHADLLEADLPALVGGPPDLLYMYRPVKPAGRGRRLYERIAEWIQEWPGGQAIMSVADCMSPFLGPGVKKLYEDEYLSVYMKD